MFSLTDPMNCPAQPIETGTHVYGTRTTDCEQCRVYNNWSRIMLTPTTMDVQHEYNTSFENVPKFIEISKLSLDDIFIFMKKITAIAAGFTLAWDNANIKKRTPNPKALEAQSEEFEQAVKVQRIAQLPPKERKMLSDKEKAIKALMDIGIDKATATANVEERMAKAGRLIKV